MISGDHLLGRTVLFFDHGHTPDPVGEFLGGLTEVEPLDVELCLPGHGRPFRDPEAKIAEARRQVDELLGKVREALAGGERTAFEIVADDHRRGEHRLAGQRLGPADRPLLSPPPGDRRRGGRGRGQRPPALAVGIASADGQLHLRPPGRRAARDRLRGAHRPSRLLEADAAAQVGAGARGRSGPERGRGDPVLSAVGPPLREEVVGYAPVERFSYTCSPACRCATTSAPSPSSRAATAPRSSTRCGPIPTVPVVGAAVVAAVRFGVKSAARRHRQASPSAAPAPPSLPKGAGPSGRSRRMTGSLDAPPAALSADRLARGSLAGDRLLAAPVLRPQPRPARLRAG